MEHFWRRLFWLFLPSVHKYQKRLTSEDLREVWRITRLLFCGSRRLGTSKKASAFSDVEQQRRRFCYHIIMRNFLFSFIVEKNFEEKFGPLRRGPSSDKWGFLSRFKSLTLPLCQIIKVLISQYFSKVSCHIPHWFRSIFLVQKSPSTHGILLMYS